MPFLLDRINHEHEICRVRDRIVTFKVNHSIIFTDDRRKRPKLLPVLYLAIKQFLGLGIAWVRKYAPRTKRTRTPLHAKLEPANNVVLVYKLSCHSDHVPSILKCRILYPAAIKERFNLLCREHWTEVSMPHNILPLVTKDIMIDIRCNTDAC